MKTGDEVDPRLDHAIEVPAEIVDKLTEEELGLSEEEESTEETKSEETTGEESDKDKEKSEELSKEEQSSSDSDEAGDEDEETKDDEPGEEKSDEGDSDEEKSDDEAGDDEGEETVYNKESDLESVFFENEEGEKVPVKQIIDDWTNNEGWKKSNTLKAQEVAEDRKKLDGVLEKLDVEGFAEAVTSEDFLEATDDWFEGKDKNPFRKVPEAIQFSEDEQKLTAESINLQIDREIFDLQKVDEKLKEKAVQEELVQFAADNGLRVPQAYKVKHYDSLSQKVEQLTTELKARNKELSKLKKTSPAKPDGKEASGKGAKKEDYAEPAKDWDEARERALNELEL